MTVDFMWQLPGHRRERMAETAGWILSCAVVTTAMAATLIWAESRTGDDGGTENAIILELDSLPPVAAIPAPPPSTPAEPASPPPAMPPDSSERLADVPEPETPLAPATEAQLPGQVAPDTSPPPPELPPPELVAAEVSDPALAKTRPRARPERGHSVQASAAPTQAASVRSAAEASAQPQSSAASRAGSQDAKTMWGAAIRKKVERRKAYPKAAQGTEGEVIVRLVIGRTGALEGLAIGRSSGSAILDEAALIAVRRAGRFPAAPEGLGGARHVFSLPIRFAP